MAERSRAYPGVPLDECVENIRQVRKALGTAAHDRETIAKALGVAVPTAIRPIAAMVHFGLLARDKSGYSISQLGRTVCDPLDGELETALKECMRNPALYAELLDRFSTDGTVPHRLATILHRHYEITHQASELAADVFLRSAKFARIIDEDLHFRDEGHEPQPADRGSEREDLDIRAEIGGPEKPAAAGAEQQFRFQLTGQRFARLIVPSSLVPRDIQIIKKQIELLELQAGDGEPDKFSGQKA